jgi:hypothetical protein
MFALFAYQETISFVNMHIADTIVSHFTGVSHPWVAAGTTINLWHQGLELRRAESCV